MKIGKIYKVVGVQQQELKYISFQLILDRIERELDLFGGEEQDLELILDRIESLSSIKLLSRGYKKLILDRIESRKPTFSPKLQVIRVDLG